MSKIKKGGENINPQNSTITLVGGGASAHLLIPFLSSSGYTVNILTRKPKRWSQNIELQYHDFDGNILKRFHGELNKISADPEIVITDADFIILCMPVSQYRHALHRIAPHVNTQKEVYIGTVFGQGGFNWMVNEIKQGFELDNIITFSFGLIPWICRVREYGKTGITYGAKPINIAAVEPRDRFEFLNKYLFEKVCLDWFGQGSFEQANHFLSLTFSVDNQILHPARCYALFKKHGGEWENAADIPFFYSDFDQLSADILASLDADYSKIRQRIKEEYPQKNFPYMMGYLRQDRYTNQTPEYTVLESILCSNTLGAIKAPTIETEEGTWQIDTDHRFFTDDIHYGLCIAKWVADHFAIEVPTIDRIINWAQDLRQENLISDGELQLDSPDLKQKFKSGVPYFYGYQTIDQIVN